MNKDVAELLEMLRQQAEEGGDGFGMVVATWCGGEPGAAGWCNMKAEHLALCTGLLRTRVDHRVLLPMFSRATETVNKDEDEESN